MKRMTYLWYPLTCLLVLGPILTLSFPAEAKTSKGITCGVRQKLVLRGYHIVSDNVGLRITGRCKVTMINSTIKAGNVGVLLQNRGKLVLVNSKVSAGAIAIKAMHRGKATLTSTTLHAKRWAIHAGQRAKVVGLMGNSLHGRYHVQDRAKILGLTARGAMPPRRAPPLGTKAPPPPAAPRAAGAPPKGNKSAAPIRCLGNQGITLRKRYIKTNGIAISLIGNCNVTLIDCWIQGKVGISVVGNGFVKIVRSFVQGKPAIQIMGNGNVSAKNSRIKGGVRKMGNGFFMNKGGNSITQ